MSTTTLTAAEPRALFSADGQTWTHNEGTGPVVKIVIGTPPQRGKEPELKELRGEVAATFADLPATVTHLHLWQIATGKTLPTLPQTLQGLDLRGCAELETLPALPATLETLDLGGCKGLKKLPANGRPKLQYLHVDGCVSLLSHQITSFLGACPAVREFTATGCSQLLELIFSEPQSGGCYPLRKLVLAGCSKLAKLPPLRPCADLRHLNVNGCSALNELPEIDADPEGGIRYLVAHECPRLREFADVDVRPVGLSKTADDNVAGYFRTLQRLRGEPGELVMAKLLLLGSGRCGKTTISQGLRWFAQTPEERAQHPSLDPAADTDSTPGIRFSAWETEFDVARGGSKRGTVHIWDFGGQEIYHNTHRLFASEGTVFILATTDPKTHGTRLDRELKAIKDEGRRLQWRQQNEYRELKYWLDYIRTALRLETIADLGRRAGKVSLLIVHTGCPSTEQAIATLRAQAGPYAELLESGELPVRAWDAKVDTSEQVFKRVQAWTAEAIGMAADRLGMRVPQTFAKVSHRCGEMLADSQASEIQPFSEWSALVKQCAPALGSLPPAQAAGLEAEQARAVLNFLHHCGRVFWLRNPAGPGEVILKQQWCLELIYTLTHPFDLCAWLHRITGEMIEEQTLRQTLLDNSSIYRGLPSHRRELFLDLLDQCNIIIRVAGGRRMAVLRDLLPDAGEPVQRRIQTAWNTLAVSQPGSTNHSFALWGDQGGMLGNSDFNEVLSFLGRQVDEQLLAKLFGDETRDGEREAHLYRSGPRYSVEWELWQDGVMMKATKADPETSLLLRIEWCSTVEAASGRRGYDGGLFIQFLSPDEDSYSERLWSLLFGSGGPLEFFKDKVKKTDMRPPDLADEYLPALRENLPQGWATWSLPKRAGVRFDVAISYRSSERAIVQPLVDELKRRQVLVYEYASDKELANADPREKPGGSRITDIYDYLRYARVLLIVPSKDYFEPPSLAGKKNLYCPVELAEAVLANAGYSEEERDRNGLMNARRLPARLLWITHAGLKSANDVETGTRKVLETYLKKVTLPRVKAAPAHRDASAISLREEESIRAAVGCVNDFINDVGRNDKQMVRVDPGDAAAVAAAIDRIMAALKMRD